MKTILMCSAWLGALGVLTGCESAPSRVPDNYPPAMVTPAVAGGFPEYGKPLLAAMMALTDQTLQGALGDLKGLAAAAEVKSGKWETMRETVAAREKSMGLGILWFALPDGNYFTPEKGLAGQSLADRDYFPRLMAGETVLGPLVFGKSGGRKVVVAAVPVTDGKKVIGAVGASLFLEKIDQKLGAAVTLPDGVVFYALSPDGTTLLSQKFPLVFDHAFDHSSPTLKAAAAQMLSKDSGEVNYIWAGVRQRVLFRTSPLTQWCFALGLNVAKAEPEAAKETKAPSTAK